MREIEGNSSKTGNSCYTDLLYTVGKIFVMDLGGVDVWGQIALETSQMYVSEGGVIKSRFAGTVSH